MTLARIGPGGVVDHSPMEAEDQWVVAASPPGERHAIVAVDE
jgi:hypothetical protein